MTDAVAAHGEASMAKGSTSFRAAAQLFGKRLREDVWQLYAWCRRCDDEIDGQDHGRGQAPMDAAERAARLQRLKVATLGALSGEPCADPAFAGLQRVAARHELPAKWPLELLDGFALDVEPKAFSGQDDLMRYCWGVAGVVGVMMAHVMGAKSDAVLRRAQDLGLAFQLTNICRDVYEDAANGRVYLPATQLRALGVEPTPAALLDPAMRDAVFAAVRAQLQLAESYYRSARAGLRGLPFRSALAIAAARGVYREIGRRILRSGPAALESRMSVSKPVLLALVGRGFLVALFSRVEMLLTPPARPALWSRL